MEDNPIKPSFEESLPIIEKELHKRKYKWQLKAIVWMDWQDVEQIIKFHIFKKWEQYDCSKPLKNWVNTIISNQFINILRNTYFSSARPCISFGGCSFNTGEDDCDYTKSQKQCSECPVFAVWEKKKKSAHDIKLPVPMVHHEIEVHDIPNTQSNLLPQITEMHEKMEKYLKPYEFKIYHCLYILGLSEKETAEKLNYKSAERFKYPGYASISKAKKVIIAKARKIIEDGEIDVI